MPKKVPEGAEPRFPISFRAPAELKARLETAAADAGRSVGQELVRRLERSFVSDELRQHVDGLLSDSLVKGEEVDKLRAELDSERKRVTELEALLRETREADQQALERTVERAVEQALGRVVTGQPAEAQVGRIEFGILNVEPFDAAHVRDEIPEER